MNRLILSLAFLLAVAAPCVAQDEPKTKDVGASFKLHLAQMRRADLDTVWDLALRVEDLGPEVTDLAVKALAEPSLAVRLALCKVLYSLENPQPASLGAILTGKDVTAAILAVRLMGNFGEDEEEAILKKALEKPLNPLLKVAAAAAMWDLTGADEWKGVLQNLLTSGNLAVVRAASLELARMGDVSLVKGFLEKNREEPSLAGRVAAAVLDAEEIRAAQTEVTIRHKDLVEEVVKLVRTSYADDSARREGETVPIDRPFLIDAAAAGIANSLDRFCGYMTKKHYDDERKRATGSYAGIGAYVRLVDFDLTGDGQKVKVLKIDRPIYSSPAPAFKAGLRSGDMVLQVYEGKDKGWTSLVGTTLAEAIEKLKGPVGTEVRIKVKRRGAKELIELRIVRRMITINVAVPDMLPGSIGYVYLKRFDNKASKDLERALTLLENQGMKGLVLDLRGNPGGSLHEVVECCRKFLHSKTSMLITFTRGRTDEWSKSYYTRRGRAHPPFPMAVLIDNDSASGSEMLSGALQAYKRAVVIGETSYGKGSGQTVFPIVASRDKAGVPQRFLRLTIFKYYLPNKTSIHKRGVRPDLVQAYDKITSFQYFWQQRLLQKEAITAYLDQHWTPPNLKLFNRLARFDGFSTGAYPGFDAFYKSLDTKLDANYVRRMVRLEVKERLQDERGKAYLRDDYQEDPQIQRAILEVLKKLGLKPESIAEYAHFAAKFP